MPRLGTESPWGRFRRRLRQTARRTPDSADLDPGCLDTIGDSFLIGLAIIAGFLLLEELVPPPAVP